MPLHPSAIQLVSPEGEYRAHPEYPIEMDDGFLRSLYRDMVVLRRADAEATNLQRQGLLKLWPPVIGQEAAQVGSVRAMEAEDFAFPTGRDFGAVLGRGVAPRDAMAVWRGDLQGGGWDVEATRLGLYTKPVGSHAPHAVGYAMALRREGVAGATLAYLGDGALATGDVHEAFVWSSVFAAPVVFFCENNQYAISVPVARQSLNPLFERASGFGFPGIQVDGNDVLACYAVTAASLARARGGGGPTLVEAYTYRMGPHTTSDDPTRYRTSEEEEAWRRRDPVLRMQLLLLHEEMCTERDLEGYEADAAAMAAQVRRACSDEATLPDAHAMFEHVYDVTPAHILEERDAWMAFREAAEELE